MESEEASDRGEIATGAPEVEGIGVVGVFLIGEEMSGKACIGARYASDGTMSSVSGASAT